MKTQTHVEPETRHILPFLAWTFGISWSAWLASAFLRIPIISQVLTIAGVFGPAIGAKLVLGKSFKELLASIGSSRKRTWVHLLILTILYTLSIVFWSPLLPSFSPLRIVLLFLMTTFLTGGNEEIGWQGFLQPSLEKILPFPLATVATGLIWAVWHLPLFFMPGSSQAGTSFLSLLPPACSPVSGWRLFTRSVSLSSIVSSFMGSLILLAKASL